MSDFREFIEQNVSTGLGKILAVKISNCFCSPFNS